MTDMSVASAIVVEDVLDTQTPETETLKRRYSGTEEGDQASKKQRISPGKISPEAVEDYTGAGAEQPLKEAPILEEARSQPRKSSIADEKQRSKRLFGALLGNLSQSGESRTSKRRQEIEVRKKAELQRQDDERLEDKQRRQEKYDAWRKLEQVRLGEENMRTRHRNLLDAANFLQTTAEPKIYYRPWDLLPDEEDRIAAQIEEAQVQVDKELREVDERRHQDGLANDGITHRIPDQGTISIETSTEPMSAAGKLSSGSDGETGEEGQAPAKSDQPEPAETLDPVITDRNTNNEAEPGSANDVEPPARDHDDVGAED